MVKKIFLTVICIFISLEVYSADLTTIEIFQNQVSSEISNRMGIIKSKPKTSSVKFYKLNLDLLLGNETFDIELVPGSKLSFEKDDLTLRTMTSYSWRGKIVGNVKSRAIFAVEGDDLSGNITIDSMTYEIRPMGDGVHSISEVDTTALKSEIPPFIPVSDPNTVPKDIQSYKDDGLTIDVMVAYTQDAAAQSSNILTEIQLFVDNTNQYYVDSGITQQVSLVKTMLVYYGESYAASTDLSRLRNTSDDYLDEVHAVRDSYGADIVTLLVARMDDACGIGYLLTKSNQGNFPSSAFNVVDIDCGSMTYAHELGHNMGASHDPDASSGNTGGWDTYSKGYTSNGNFRTIMAYDTGCPAGCPRIGHFSNTNNTYANPTGAAGQDNVITLNESRTVVANFRTSVGGLPYGKDTDLWDVCFIGLVKGEKGLPHILLIAVLFLVVPFLIYIYPTMFRYLKIIPFLVLTLLLIADYSNAQVATPSLDYLQYSEMPASAGYRDKSFVTGAISYGTGTQVSDVSGGGENDVEKLQGMAFLNKKMGSIDIEFVVEPTRRALTINDQEVIYNERKIIVNTAYLLSDGFSTGIKGYYFQSESDDSNSIVVDLFAFGGGVSKKLNDKITVAAGLSYFSETETDAKNLSYLEAVVGAGYKVKSAKPFRFEYSVTYSPKAVNNGSGTVNTNMKPKTYTHRVSFDLINQNYLTTANVKHITEEALNTSYEDKTSVIGKFSLSTNLKQYNNMRIGGFLKYKTETYGTSSATSTEIGCFITKLF
ncbi:MAG: hypothetical protein GY760_22850 [Deltaproteobacteria bacterium]|nr:hypothetical protein [Deltaproteobacteria bacterium]